MYRHLALTALVVIGSPGLAPPALAQGESGRAVELEGRYWVPQTHSRIRVESNGLGTDIDFKKDLGVPDTSFPQARFTYQGAGRSKLHFTYTPIDYTGDNTVNRTLLFNGKQYTVGSRVVSEVEVQHLQFSWAYQFVNVRDGTFKLGSLVELNGFLLKGRLQAPTLPVDEKEDIAAGLPTAGLAMDINPHRVVNIFGEVSGMKIGKYGYFVSSDAGVKIRPIKSLFLTVGYRNFNLHIKNEPDFARLELRGPFFGGGVRF